MINIDAALEPVREMIENISTGYEGAYTHTGELRQRWRESKLDAGEVSVNLRLDWELVDEDLIRDQKDIAQMMLSNLKLDLEDLIENGDVNKTQDWLLKSMDGEKKRGKKAVEFVVLGAHLEIEPREKKSSTEYTLFLRPYIRFE